MDKLSEYNDFKSRLELLENDPKYFHMKRFYTYTYSFWCIAVFLTTLIIFFLIDTILNQNAFGPAVPSQGGLIQSIQGKAQVQVNERTLDLKNTRFPYSLSEGDKLHGLSTDAEILIQISKEQRMVLSSGFKMNILGFGDDLVYFLYQGEVQVISGDNQMSKEYILATPHAQMTIKNKPIHVRVHSVDGFTEVSGEVAIRPSTLFSTTVNKIPAKIQTELNKIKVFSERNEGRIIPAKIMINEKDFVVYERLIETGYFQSLVPNMLFKSFILR